MKISPARSAAFDVLFRIETERAFSSVLLPYYEEGLSAQDRGLCHELVLGTLRRQIYLDRIIHELVRGKTVDVEVRIALRIGLYQLIYLDRIPNHSAINESVELIARAKKVSAKGFVNGVLRAFTRKSPEIKFADQVDRVSVETSHPRWLIERWIEKFGEEIAFSVTASNNEVPSICFRLLAPIVPEADWEPSNVVPGAYRAMNSGRLREVYDAGEIYFQDEASQLAALAISVPASGSFLDVCAAPGGKTGFVTSAHAGIGLSIAGEINDARTRFLRENLHRQGQVNVHVLQYDALQGLPFAEGSFDAVLVDAPCSGTGTIRHNPEIRYFLVTDDFKDLPEKQHDILQNASKTVRPGGMLVYSTCSLEPEEGEAVIRRFLENNKDFRSTLPQVPKAFVTTDGFARTWPHRDGMDGFFISALTRSGTD